MLKVLHTSDLHLGKKLFKVDRLDEQERFLDWLVHSCRTYEIDILIIAGDIFDTPSPPHEAVRLYFSFLNKMSELKNTETLIIAGNHDSRSFIQAPNEILMKNNIRVWGELKEDPNEHKYSFSKNGQVYTFYALPYFRSYDFIKWQQFYFKETAINNDENREEIFLKVLQKFLDPNTEHRNFFIGHHLFGPYSLTGSEQAISLSGLDSIPISYFQDFNYMALGHIHKYQKVSSKISAYYSGSPYPLRFSETEVKKINLITFAEDKMEVEAISIPQSRKLYELNTSDEKVLSDLDQFLETEEQGPLTNLLAVNVIIDKPTVGLSDLIREKLLKSNTNLVYLKNRLRDESLTSVPSVNNDLTIEDLFNEYYQSKFNNKKVPKKVIEEFYELLAIKEGHEI